MRVYPLVLLLAATACGSRSLDRCRDVPPAELQTLPRFLSGTGLYVDVKAGTLAPEVRTYTPRFELWSDGAVKRRWVWLPPGATVDTSDPDVWQLPPGTKLWKEFTRDGVRVETRLLWRTARDWVPAAYVWNAEGTDAELRPEGQQDARGTRHDVPAASQCMGCHGWHPSRALGFSAVQLARTVELAALVEEGRLSHAPPARLDPPGTETEQAALGYLHANCGHCHNADRPQPSFSDAMRTRCFNPENGVDLWLATDRLGSMHETPAYETLVGPFVKPGRPDDSRLIELVSRRGKGLHMPPLGTEEVDQEGVRLLRAWMEGL